MRVLAWLARKIGIVCDEPMVVEIPAALVNASKEEGAQVFVNFTVVQQMHGHNLFVQHGPGDEQ